MIFSDLRPGYMVELRNGLRFLLTRINSKTMPLVGITEGNAWIEFNKRHYSDDMRFTLLHNDNYDIVKVWGYSNLVTYVNNFDCPGRHRELLYERGKARVLTLEEVENILGYPITIKEDKKK